MDGPGMKIGLGGIVILGAGIVFGLETLGQLYYAVLVVGVVLIGYGLVQLYQARGAGQDDDSSDAGNPAHDLLLQTLSRLSGADTNIDPIEIETIRKIYSDVAGKDVSESEVRNAARTKFSENQPFRDYLAKQAAGIGTDDKMMIVKALVTVIQADGRTSPFEVEFFNDCVSAFGLTPADIADLTA